MDSVLRVKYVAAALEQVLVPSAEFVTIIGAMLLRPAYALPSLLLFCANASKRTRALNENPSGVLGRIMLKVNFVDAVRARFIDST